MRGMPAQRSATATVCAASALTWQASHGWPEPPERAHQGTYTWKPTDYATPTCLQRARPGRPTRPAPGGGRGGPGRQTRLRCPRPCRARAAERACSGAAGSAREWRAGGGGMQRCLRCQGLRGGRVPGAAKTRGDDVDWTATSHKSSGAHAAQRSAAAGSYLQQLRQRRGAHEWVVQL